MTTISTSITAHQRQALTAATATIGVITRSWEKHLADLETTNAALRRQVQHKDARINRLIAHIALLEGVDIDVARVKHLPPEGNQ